MDEFLTVFGPARCLGIEQIMASMLLAFVLCTVCAVVYSWTHQGLSYSRTFVHALILGGMIVAMIIMAIGNNLARGLGILGTLAIVRFRTPIRDTRDMMFLFLCLGIGIACGAGTLDVAIVGTLLVCAVALFLNWSPFASRREYEGLLRFVLPHESTQENNITDVLHECCSAFHMIAMREALQGDSMEYSYQVRLIDPSYQKDIIDKIHDIEGVSDTNLLMQRSTVEL
jgi:uncharacterized membrane protein YhiD involved in acid resistance